MSEGRSLKDVGPDVTILDLGLGIAGCAWNRQVLREGDTVTAHWSNAEVEVLVTYVGPPRGPEVKA